MSAQAGIGAQSNYFSQVFILVRTSATQLVRRPSHSRRAEAAQRSARHVLLLAAILGPDPPARPRQPLACSHPDRFWKIDLCAVVTGGDTGRPCADDPAMAGKLTV